MNTLTERLFPVNLHHLAEALGVTIPSDITAIVKGICTDSRALRAGELFVALVGDRFDGHDWVATCAQNQAVGAVVRKGYASRELPAHFPLLEVDDTLRALGDIAQWLRGKISVPVLGLTGSVGKTTTKEMARGVLSQGFTVHATEGNHNNLIGVPLTIFATPAGMQWMVVEMGTDRPGEIARLAQIAQPSYGILTAIAPSHLERFETLDAIVDEKGALLEAIPAHGWAIIPAEGYGAQRLAERCQCPKFTFGWDETADYYPQDVQLDRNGCVRFVINLPDGQFTVRLRLPGRHQALLATAAAAVGVHTGISGVNIVQGLEKVQAVSGRSQLLRLDKELILLADHYNANPTSVVAALETLKNLPARRAVAVLGDMYELGPDSGLHHRQVGESVFELGVELLICVGPRAKDIQTSALQSGCAVKHVIWFETTDEAAISVPKLLQPGDAVLAKASRAMGFEKIVDAIKSDFTRRGEFSNGQQSSAMLSTAE